VLELRDLLGLGLESWLYGRGYRHLGYETPGYEKVRVRNVWKPWL